MLGVRREGITEAAGNLQRAGIHPLPPRPHCGARSGRDWRAGACECYAVVKKELDRLLSDVRYRQDAPAIAA